MDSKGNLESYEFRTIENIRETVGWLDNQCQHDLGKWVAKDFMVLDGLIRKMAEEIRTAKKATKNKVAVEALASALFAYEAVYDL